MTASTKLRVLLCGLCSAPAKFRQMMDIVLSDLKCHSSLVYLDDVVAFSTTFEQHIKRLEAVLQTIRTAGLSLKPEKCCSGYEEHKLLARIVSRFDPTLKRPRQLLSSRHRRQNAMYTPISEHLCVYYHRFVQHFSQIAEPLPQLIRMTAPSFGFSTVGRFPRPSTTTAKPAGPWSL